MNAAVLDFERDVVELEQKIEGLKRLAPVGQDVAAEIVRLEARAQQLLRQTFAELSAWQVVQLSRHPARPYTLDYAELLLTDFFELRGDRLYGDDPAIVGGLGRLDGRPVTLLGHQKGRSTRDNVRRNFGMPRPEGYRKAKRLMELAGRFRRPVITLIDTPGAFPGIDAEERGQAEAIARNLELMIELPVPIVAVVIGEGGSGGALALGVADRILMLEHSVYSVISPEGCASILWKDSAAVPRAAEVLRLRAEDVLGLGVADEVIPEPLGGAHRAPRAMAEALGAALRRQLGELIALPLAELLERRYAKYRRMGAFLER
ncbi:MAG: acetyl-CoA carboxylase carboxyltransferase subunit alpha [Proteobacteria bacterium]|nr:acetyl-CoA carboxylase carboxyltransferase subunit alpha [Pseudomonadota bacterium]